MRNRIPTSEIATALRISPSRVHQLARSRTTGKGELLIDKLSIKVDGRRRWVPSSIDRLRPWPVGRPVGSTK